MTVFSSKTSSEFRFRRQTAFLLLKLSCLIKVTFREPSPTVAAGSDCWEISCDTLWKEMSGEVLSASLCILWHGDDPTLALGRPNHEWCFECFGLGVCVWDHCHTQKNVSIANQMLCRLYYISRWLKCNPNMTVSTIFYRWLQTHSNCSPDHHCTYWQRLQKCQLWIHQSIRPYCSF